jgi:hypothetical protein
MLKKKPRDLSRPGGDFVAPGNKTVFFYCKPFQSSQNLLPPFQAIPVRPKPSSFIPSHFSEAKTNFLHSKPFQSGQNQPPLYQAIPVWPILPINPSSNICLVAAGHRIFQLLLQKGQVSKKYRRLFRFSTLFWYENLRACLSNGFFSLRTGSVKVQPIRTLYVHTATK